MNFGSIIPRRARTNVPAERENWSDPLVSFRNEMDRVFDEFFTGFGSPATRAARGGGIDFLPVVDVSETEKDLVVTAEMPGLKEDDFEVTLVGDVLTIKGEKKEETEDKNGDSYHVERRFGSFVRSIPLPFEVKDENVDARYDKGVLTVRVPKPDDVQRSVRRIDVKAA